MRVGVDARHLTAGRGVARYTRALLGALAAAHPEDEWLAFVPGREPVRAVPAGVRLVRHALPGRALFGAAAVTGRPRLDDLLGGAIDVVWIPAPAPLAVSPGVPLVLTVHDRSFEERPADFTRYERLWHQLARPRALARRAAAVVCDTSAGRDDLARAWGVEATVVSPGPLIDRTERARARAAVNGGAPYLLFVGALEPRKAPDVLADAYARARARGLEAELVVLGDGRMPIAGTGVRRVAPAADDRELAALYAGALAVVAPSWLEGFGLPPVEAAALGTPSVVSDLPVFAETLGDGALRVAPGDAAGLADALVRIAGDAALRSELGVAARQAAVRYDWGRSAEAMHAVLAAAAAR
jgi:glycosyltransferase involved in cell wall biosynthesis